jgi:hypothetical protein
MGHARTPGRRLRADCRCVRRCITPEADGSTEAAARFVACRSRSSRRHHPPLAGLHWKMAATLTATLRGDPIEHGNIRVVESSRQGLRVGQWGCATMTCECPITAERLATVWAFAGRDQPQFSDSMNPGCAVSVCGRRRLSGGCPFTTLLSSRTLRLLAQLHLGILCELQA